MTKVRILVIKCSHSGRQRPRVKVCHTLLGRRIDPRAGDLSTAYHLPCAYYIIAPNLSLWVVYPHDLHIYLLSLLYLNTMRHFDVCSGSYSTFILLILPYILYLVNDRKTNMQILRFTTCSCRVSDIFKFSKRLQKHCFYCKINYLSTYFMVLFFHPSCSFLPICLIFFAF